MSLTVREAIDRRRKKNPNKILPMNFLLSWLWNFLRPKLINFKTSLSGVGLILLGLSTGWKEIEALAAGGTPDVDILTMAGGNIMAGVGLLTARDDDRTAAESIGVDEALNRDAKAKAKRLPKGGAKS